MTTSTSLYRRLLVFLYPYKGRLSLAISCMIVLAACTAAMAWAMKPILDEALRARMLI